MSLVFLENCSYKKECIATFVYWHYSIFLYQSKQQMVLNAIRFLHSSLIANIATISINVQQKFSLAL